MSKQLYDIMRCADGVTRACKLVDGVLIDPSLPKKSELSEKKDAEKKNQTKNQYPRPTTK